MFAFIFHIEILCFFLHAVSTFSIYILYIEFINWKHIFKIKNRTRALIKKHICPTKFDQRKMFAITACVLLWYICIYICAYIYLYNIDIFIPLCRHCLYGSFVINTWHHNRSQKYNNAPPAPPTSAHFIDYVGVHFLL